MDVTGKTAARVLYISYDGLTDPLGQSQVLPYLQQLAAMGYQFTILSFEKKARFDRDREIIERITRDSGMEWVPLSFTASPPVLSKMYDRYRMWRTAKRLHREKKFDLIHCRSYVAAEAGLRLKRKFGVKMLFDMRGFWADEKVDNGQWQLGNPFFRSVYKLYKKKERNFLLEADGIVSLTQAAKDYLLKQEGLAHLCIEVIPCCADLEHFDFNRIRPEEVQQLRASLGLAGGEKVMTYLGSVGGWYMTQEMFSFFALLQRQYPEYRMLILTKDEPERIKKEAREAGIKPESLIITYSDRSRLPLFLALSSCSLFFIRNTFSKTASSPTKHAELMGMGLPVICNSIGDTGNIIRQTGTGLLVEQFDPNSLKGAAAQMGEIESLDRHHIRACAINYFDLRTGAAKYLNLYRKMLGADQ